MEIGGSQKGISEICEVANPIGANTANHSTSGVFQYIKTYGVKGFLQRAAELAKTYSGRFEPPATLEEKAERGELFV